MRVVFKDGIYDTPGSCPTNGCRARKFNPERDTAVTIDWQKLKLQEAEAEGKEAGESVQHHINASEQAYMSVVICWTHH